MSHLARFIALLCLIAPATLQARWIEARSPNFIVYSDGGEGDLRKSVALLENYDQILRTLTGTIAPPSRAPLKVYLVKSPKDLAIVEPVPPGVLGFYRARVGGTAAFAVRSGQPGLGGEQVLLHEYAHHFTARYYPAYYPGWFNEGFAEYVMTAKADGDRIEIGRYNPGRAADLLRGTWLPVDRILSGKCCTNRAEMAQFYAESWLIVHYLFADEGRRAALTRYLADLQREVPEAEAFKAAFGIDHDAFEAHLKRYMTAGIPYGAMPRPVGPQAAITIRTLPQSADDLLLPHAALMIGVVPSAREPALVAAIRKAAALYPDDPYARRVLGRAEIAGGDKATGMAIIDQLLAADPENAELLYIRGTVDFYAGRKDDARRAELYAAANPWFKRAAAADPAYYTAVYRLAQTSLSPAGQVADATVDQLLSAHELAPLVGDIAIDAAAALYAKGRKAEAEIALVPIATNPHNGNAERARQLLQQVRAAK
ncbi:tetratricopeptide repeat protein [Sphingomonas crocodyli]|uniref:DUF1570 domain-containing protein n=1 Tax=Sphingomonas crocodyli TaxID=1979270 RepID=A0A437LZN6_9SPHN|nr:hypothetical protein [Sphingomonas crocodyli]RVT90816.1 hypothetical protein EOD43_14810 [Sphingomonas crocodyli]